MNRMCRKLRASSWRRPRFAAFALRHARIVTDPKKLAWLNAEVADRRRREEAEQPVHSMDA